MENNNDKKITTPQAIVVAGVIIMIAILLTRTNTSAIKVAENKTLSEQIGISKEAFADCIKNIDTEALSNKIKNDVDSAMKGVPADQRGTPYSIIVGKNGPITDIRGATSVENLKILIDEASAGKSKEKYTGTLNPVTQDDHILGSPTAPITIVEYSDFECPYCKAFHATLEQTVKESNGSVAWVYRNWPIHQNSFQKLVAAECAAKIKGNDAFWSYSNLLFGLLKTSQEAAPSEQL